MARRVLQHALRKFSPPPPSITIRSTRLFVPPPHTLASKAGQAFQPIRVAVCGRKNAPPLFETMVVLGRDLCLARIRQAEANLQSLLSAETLTMLELVAERLQLPASRFPNSLVARCLKACQCARGGGTNQRLAFGLLGDFKAVGGGVIELRIDFGAG